jgi:hypothetical protein
MSTFTIGEAKEHLAQCKSGAEALLEKLEALHQSGLVIDLRAASGPLVPIPMAKCAAPKSGFVIVEDYVAAMEDIIGWLSDLIEGLDAPDERAFAEGEVPRK